MLLACVNMKCYIICRTFKRFTFKNETISNIYRVLHIKLYAIKTINIKTTRGYEKSIKKKNRVYCYKVAVVGRKFGRLHKKGDFFFHYPGILSTKVL